MSRSVFGSSWFNHSFERRQLCKYEEMEALLIRLTGYDMLKLLTLLSEGYVIRKENKNVRT